MGSSLKGGAESTSSVPGFVTEGGEFGVDRAMQLAEMGYMPYFGPDVAALAPKQYAAMQGTDMMAGAFGMPTPGGGMGGGNPNAGAQMQTGQYQQAQVGDSEKAQFINDMYQQQLGRAPDQAGYDYYMSQDIDMSNPGQFAQGFNQGISVDPMTGLPAAGNFGGMGGYSSGPVYQGALQELERRNPGQYEAYTSMFVDPQTGESPSGLLNEVTGGGNAGGGMPTEPGDRYGQKSGDYTWDGRVWRSRNEWGK